MPDTPLRPDELETYKTPVQTESEASDGATPDSRPWVAVGLVLLVLFVLMLLAAIAFGIVR